MGAPYNRVKFSIAESDFYFKRVLTKNLLNNPFYNLMKDCNNGHELIKQLYLRQEDIFLIELYMPIMTGFEAIKFIRNSGNKTPIITYSPTFQADMYALLKPFSSVYYCEKKGMVITDILKNYVLSSTKSYDEYLLQWKDKTLEFYEEIEKEKMEKNRPTLIEIQIMRLSYEGLTNKEIGKKLNLSARTIDTYVSRLLQKLGLRNKIDLVRFCVEQGYYNYSK